MKKIEGRHQNLRTLLGGQKYTIPYYQREYMWQTKQIEDLIDDLTSEFLEYYDESHERDCVEKYGTYFMGSIVLAGDGKSIIDGQQRFTSITLLLIYLYNRIKDLDSEAHSLTDLIYSIKYGKKSFNIQVAEREECMNAIFNNHEFDVDNEKNESVKNLYERYRDIARLFPHDKISDDMILFFCDWLIEKVSFIEILAATEQDAHKVFVTMNDRGLSLTSTEMLKGYLLSEIKNDDIRLKLNEIWKDKISSLKENDKDGDETFIKTWLRAQYAESIRGTKKGAENKDFDIIGGPFHEWVRDEKNKLGLDKSKDFESFIEEFAWFSDRYMELHEAERTFNEKSKYIYYNARVNFTLQSQLLLAPLCYGKDTKEEAMKKMNLVARFIDLYIVSRFTNYKSLNYSTIKNYVFNLTKDIRRCSTEELKIKLNNQFNRLEHHPEEGIPTLQVNGYTKRYIKNMLARIIGFIQEETGDTVEYIDLMTTRKDPFEIEHIISNHFEWHTKEYSDQNDFDRWRNNVGALLLLHKSINTSLNDSPYSDKLEAYSTKGNIYSESLNYPAYKNNPRFLKFIEENNLQFKPYVAFGKLEIKERNELLIQLTNLVWNNKMFLGDCDE